ncbi:MAG: 4'-phosphopantetheinyl transferase superfamily protein, partial [Desulfovibrio sp.]|nr:4'-phosphopantetheinyl transferase superfamily protein [Desulfovibrio sp.]
MILGTGIDLASLQRLERGAERFGERFLARVLSAEERDRLPSGNARARFLAGRWAAKEALAKALG